MASTRIIERESEIVAFIEDYISQGQSVKKPLLVQMKQGRCRLEIRDDFVSKFGKLMLCIDLDPIKGKRYFKDGKTRTVEGISDHPDLYSHYLLPSGYDPATPPAFLLDSCTGEDSSILTPQFLMEVVQNLRIPCVYLAPARWFDFNGQYISQKPDLSGFDEVWYEPTVKGWLMDMKSDEQLPNKKRALRTGYGYDFFKNSKWDNELLDLIVSKSKERRFELVLGFAESIKDRDSFDSLVPGDFLKSAEPTVTLALEGLMSYFTNLLIARQIQIIAPEDFIFDFESKDKWWWCGSPRINAVVDEAFPKYLKDTEFDWLFDLSKPVPEDIIKETKQIIEDYKAKYGSVSYRKDEAEKYNSPRAILERWFGKKHNEE